MKGWVGQKDFSNRKSKGEGVSCLHAAQCQELRGDPPLAYRSSAKAMARDTLGHFTGRETRLSVCLGITQVGIRKHLPGTEQETKIQLMWEAGCGSDSPPPSPEISETGDFHASFAGGSAWNRAVSQHLLGDARSWEMPADMWATRTLTQRWRTCKGGLVRVTNKAGAPRPSKCPRAFLGETGSQSL